MAADARRRHHWAVRVRAYEPAEFAEVAAVTQAVSTSVAPAAENSTKDKDRWCENDYQLDIALAEDRESTSESSTARRKWA